MKMKVAIIHYDISMRTGAQRLVLGMGNAMKKLGHEVAYFTAIYNKNKAFEEFQSENVIISNGKLDYFGKFRALTAYFESKKLMQKGIKKFKPDLYIFSSNYYLASNYSPSIIYCHHPEQLLVKKNDPITKFLHKPIDWSENNGFKHTNNILCNSEFTKNAIRDKFNKESSILFPGVDIDKFSMNEIEEDYILTVNRIVPSKNLQFAIELVQKAKMSKNNIKLVIAGVKQLGFEWYFEDLQKKIKKYNLEKNIEIRIDIQDDELIELYKKCMIFLYTPKEEHFGIAPIEAMSCGKPVMAFNTGGPKETIVNEETGYLLDDNLDIWNEKLLLLLNNKEKRREMGNTARHRVVKKFSWNSFTEELSKNLKDIQSN